MIRNKARLLATAWLVLELCVWLCAFFAAYAVRFGTLRFEWPLQHGVVLVTALTTWTLWYRRVDRSHSGRTTPIFREVFQLLVGGGATFLSVVVVLFLLHIHEVGRIFLTLFAAFSTVGIVGMRIALRAGLRRLRAKGWDYRRLAIVSDGAWPEELIRLIREHREWGLEIAGLVHVKDESAASSLPSLGVIDEMATILESNVIDEVVFAVENLNLERLERAFSDCNEAGVHTRVLLNCFPRRTSRFDLDDLDGVPMLAFQATRQAELELIAKRLFDVAIASLVGIVAAPVCVLIALAIKLTSPGPVLFVQRRIGLHGRAFNLLKFRSMVVDAEARKETLLPFNEMSGPAFKLTEDPRVTTIGRWLRRTSLDELPQIWNVLRGEMSIVGPRPAVPEEVLRYARWQRRRLSVKPGMTCTWQINGRNDVDFETWMKLDLSYIDNWSLWLDLKIVLFTIPAVLSARGAR